MTKTSRDYRTGHGPVHASPVSEIVQDDGDECAAILREWRHQKEPAIDRWPLSYGLLDRVRVGDDVELAFAYSLRDFLFALVPLEKGIAVAEPIIVEERYDSPSLERALTKFAYGEYGNFEKKHQFRQYRAPSSFDVLDVVRVARCMEVAFASSKAKDAYAIIRYQQAHRYNSKKRMLPLIVIHAKYDTPDLMAALLRFADGNYAEVDKALMTYNRAVDLYNAGVDAENAMCSGGPRLFNRGYSARRPKVKLPTQADWGDT
jgi:hypothetical protein